jgi:nitroreductase
VPEAMAVTRDTRALLRANAADWLSVVARRRARRAYADVPVDNLVLETLGSFADLWRPYPDARAVVIAKPTIDVFTGVIGSYGKMRAAPHLIVFIADTSGDFRDQHVGYTGEAVVLEATRLGLATCWVGGFFDPRKATRLVALAPHERVVAVSPLGYAFGTDGTGGSSITSAIGAYRRKPVSQIAPSVLSRNWPSWAVAAVETARLAPSTVNRQPWRFRLEGGGLVVSKDNFLETSRVSKRLDIGIAMLHIDLAATAHGIDGIWTDLHGGDVARFDPISTDS